MKGDKEIRSSVGFSSEEQKEMFRSFIAHIKTKTGNLSGDECLKALIAYNLTLDDKGNKI